METNVTNLENFKKEIIDWPYPVIKKEFDRITWLVKSYEKSRSNEGLNNRKMREYSFFLEKIKTIQGELKRREEEKKTPTGPRLETKETEEVKEVKEVKEEVKTEHGEFKPVLSFSDFPKGFKILDFPNYSIKTRKGVMRSLKKGGVFRFHASGDNKKNKYYRFNLKEKGKQTPLYFKLEEIKGAMETGFCEPFNRKERKAGGVLRGRTKRLSKLALRKLKTRLDSGNTSYNKYCLLSSNGRNTFQYRKKGELLLIKSFNSLKEAVEFRDDFFKEKEPKLYKLLQSYKTKVKQTKEVAPRQKVTKVGLEDTFEAKVQRIREKNAQIEQLRVEIQGLKEAIVKEI